MSFSQDLVRRIPFVAADSLSRLSHVTFMRTSPGIQTTNSCHTFEFANCPNFVAAGTFKPIDPCHIHERVCYGVATVSRID